MDGWTAAQLARQLMTQHGLKDWQFRFNRRKRALGLCRYEEKFIELSLYFVTANDEPAIVDTILHEIAHALAGHRAGHGPRWRRFCQKVGAAPQRCGHAAMPPGKWRAVCPGCGYAYTRYRRPPLGSTYACSDCGFDRGTLVFKPHLPL